MEDEGIVTCCLNVRSVADEERQQRLANVAPWSLKRDMVADVVMPMHLGIVSLCFLSDYFEVLCIDKIRNKQVVDL
jgi:hypothetical protein